MESREKVLRNLSSLVFELVNSEKPMLWELGHYLADNLILRIGLYLAEKDGNMLSDTSFPIIYKKFIDPICYKFITYDQIKPFHKQRNVFQHAFDSLDYQIRKEMAMEYYEKASIIMTLTGIMNDEFFISTDFLRDEIKYLSGKDIKKSEWDKYLKTVKAVDYFWRNIIFSEELELEDKNQERKYIPFYIRDVSKICGSFEEFGNFSIENINTSFQDIIKKLSTLEFNLKSLIECDVSRLREVYDLRPTSSDHLWILKSLNKIYKTTTNSKDSFEIDEIVSPLVNLGYNINIFIRRYINHITPNS